MGSPASARNDLGRGAEDALQHEPQGLVVVERHRRLVQQLVERFAGVAEDLLVAAQPEAGVGAHYQRVELEGEALRPGHAGGAGFADEGGHPGVEGGGDRVADGAGTVVVLS